MEWGAVFEGKAPIASIAEAIESSAPEFGLRSARTQSDKQEIVIETVQTRSPFVALILALPQHITWTITKSDERVTMTRDSRALPWGLATGVILCLAANAFLAHGSEWPFWNRADAAAGSAMMLICVLIGVCLLFVAYYVVFAPGGNQVDGLTLRVLSTVESSGGTMEAFQQRISGRHALRTTVFLLYVFCIVSRAIVNLAQSSTSRPPLGFVILIVLLVALVPPLVYVLSLLSREGLNLRLSAMAPALTLAAAMLAYTIIPIPFVILGSNGNEKSTSLKRLQETEVPRQTTQSVTSVGHETRVKEASSSRVSLTRLIVLVHALGSCLIAFAMVGTLHSSLSTSLRIQPFALRMSNRSGLPDTRKAIAGQGNLVSIRFALGAIWLIFTALLFIGVANSLSVLCYILLSVRSPCVPAFWPEAIDVSSALANVAFHGTTFASYASAATRALWGAHGALLLALVTSAVGGFLLPRRRELRRLRIVSNQESAQHERVQAILSQLAEKAGIDSPKLAIIPGHHVDICADRFGLLRSEAWIKVSEGTLATFDREGREAQLEALLAHEFAHLVARDCRIDNVLRFMGRVTFVGDGFVRSLQDTFGNEQRADMKAVESFGAAPDALIKGLWLMRNAREAAIGDYVSAPGGLALSPRTHREAMWILEHGIESLGLLRRWGLSARCLWNYYTGADSAAYWHPAIDERVARLREMARANAAHR